MARQARAGAGRPADPAILCRLLGVGRTFWQVNLRANQQALYPERTVRSIKRRMGSQEAGDVSAWKTSPPRRKSQKVILREPGGVDSTCRWVSDPNEPSSRCPLTSPMRSALPRAKRARWRAPGTGPHPQRAHRSQPRLWLRRRLPAHGPDIRSGRRHVRRFRGNGGGRHHGSTRESR